MTSFLIAMLFGFLQALLLSRLIAAVNRGKKGRVFLLCLIIFASYGAAIWLVMFRFMGYLANLLCGFLAGLPLSGILMFFYSSYLSRHLARLKSRILMRIRYRR